MMEVIAGAAVSLALALGGALMKTMFSQNNRLGRLEQANDSRKELEREREQNTKSALVRIEQATRRLEEKVDHILINGVPRAVSQ